jgi:hypothetical protein
MSASTSTITLTTDLSTPWVLWFHPIDGEAYDLASFERLSDIRTVGDYLTTIGSIKNYTSGMFYLMREGIPPMWEHEANAQGGYWSYRIPKARANGTWTDFCSAAVGNVLTRSLEDMQWINGISISPKINNAIIKIWTSVDNFPHHRLPDNIGEQYMSGGVYKKATEMLQQAVAGAQTVPGWDPAAQES